MWSFLKCCGDEKFLKIITDEERNIDKEDSMKSYKKNTCKKAEGRSKTDRKRE